MAQSVEVVLPPPLKAEPLASGVQVQPVSLTRLAGNIAAGTPWFQEASPPYFLMPCILTEKPIRWSEADNKIGGFEAFERIFRDELKKAGFRAGGDPTNLFEDQKAADLQVGALINMLRVRTCATTSVSTVTGGTGVMEVEWQIYSVTQAKILARITTRGGFEIKSRRDFDLTPLIRGIFGDNVARLAADEQFRRLVTLSAPTVVAPTVPTTSAVKIALAPGDRVTSLASAVKSVVTIYAGDGLGSGVLVSDDGYVLTNHHVAGSSGQVRVHWPDGTDTIGEVVRGDPRRDVALVKTTAKGPALAVRRTGAQLGETVFAIGTPLDKQFASTLTRGIVSATRLVDGLAMIQSDVAVDHGNSGGPLLDEKGQIIALTVSGYQPDNVSHNINFFIPIVDALAALDLKPTN